MRRQIEILQPMTDRETVLFPVFSEKELEKAQPSMRDCFILKFEDDDGMIMVFNYLLVLLLLVSNLVCGSLS